jgi:hypothetical protein
MHHKSLKKSESDWYLIGRKLGVDRQQGVLANLSMSPAPGSLLVASVVLAIAVEYIIFLVLIVPCDNANLHLTCGKTRHESEAGEKRCI